MPEYDPLSLRFYERRESELEALRAECNRLASERDLLTIELRTAKLAAHLAREERDSLAEDNRRLLNGAAELIAHNRRLSESLKQALSPERSAA